MVGNMQKAVAYVRVSSKEQEREGFSIPAQIKLIEEYAAKNNLKIVKIFSESESAKIAGRAQFRKMIEFLTSNLDVNHILVEKTDRLYRNQRDWVDLDYETMDLNLHLIKENDILNKKSKSHQKFIHGIKVLMAKNYCDNLSEEVIKGQTFKASTGIWPSCAPIGYMNKLDDRTVVPHPKESKFINKLFELAATGQFSLRRLGKEAFEMGLRGKRNGKMGKSSISRILANPIYYGDFIWAGKEYKGKHDPLISKDLFNTVQTAMGFVQKPRMTKNQFSFSGMFTCAHCGCAITAEKKTKKSGKSYIYYHCTNGKGVCGNVTFLPESKIDHSISEALAKIHLRSEIVEWTREALLESSKEEREFREAKVKNLNTRYVKLETLISKVYDDKLEGRIEPELWESKTAQFKLEQEEITNQLICLNRTNTSYLQEGVRLMEFASRAAELFKSMTVDEKREMLGLVLSNRMIKNGTVEYDYKMPFAMFTNVTNLDEWRGKVNEFRTYCREHLAA